MRIDLLVTLVLQLVNGYAVLDNVFINGQGPYRFVVDTGAQTTSMDARIARALNLSPTYRVTLSTKGGDGTVPATVVSTISAGSASAGDLEVVWYELPFGGAFGQPIAGILGQNFLSRFDYLLDYKNRRLILAAPGQLDAMIQGERIAIQVVDGLVKLPVRFCEGSAEQFAVLDSGIPMPLTSSAPCANPAGATAISTSFGNREAQVARLKTVWVGGACFREVLAVIDVGSGANADALLPVRLLNSVFVNFRGRVAVINPTVVYPSDRMPSETRARRPGSAPARPGPGTVTPG